MATMQYLNSDETPEPALKRARRNDDSTDSFAHRVKAARTATAAGASLCSANSGSRLGLTQTATEADENKSIMVVAREVVLDLTDDTQDYREVLASARSKALTGEVQEFTCVSHLEQPFFIKDLADILRHVRHLEILSLFSIALTGTSADFAEFARVLRSHKFLKEVHLVDCGMLGGWRDPNCKEGENSTENSSMSSASGGGGSITSAAGRSIITVTSMKKNEPPSMDIILNALAQIPTLEYVELYGVPCMNFDRSGDGDEVSDHQVLMQEGEGDQDIPMVPMAADDSETFSDEDFLDDYDEDIRGIPGNRKGKTPNKKLSLMMSPEAIAGLCRAPAITNLGLEDLSLNEDHLDAMMNALTLKSSRISELKMWGCNIGDKGSQHIARMLQNNNTLESLDLANNHIQEEGCIAISKALHANTSLRSLNLMGNECSQTYDTKEGSQCYEALLELLRKNKTLTDLVLEPFEQDEEADVPEFIFIPATIEDDASSAS